MARSWFIAGISSVSGRLISVVCLTLTREELSSSLQASFGEIDVVLDGTKDFVIDRFFVA